MTTIQIKSPLSEAETANVADRGLSGRLAAVAVWHTSGMADLLSDYDAEPSHYVVTKDGKHVIFKVMVDGVPNQQLIEPYLATGFEVTLQFMLKGVDLNSSWSR